MLVHEDDAGGRHEKNHRSGNHAGDQMRPKNYFVQQLHAGQSPCASLTVVGAQNAKLGAQPVAQDVLFIPQVVFSRVNVAHLVIDIGQVALA